MRKEMSNCIYIKC